MSCPCAVSVTCRLSPEVRRRTLRPPAGALPRRSAPWHGLPERVQGQTRLRLQVVREAGQVLGAVVGHEDEILEPDAADALAVEAGLDGDDVAGLQRLVRDLAHPRLLVHL